MVRDSVLRTFRRLTGICCPYILKMRAGISSKTCVHLYKSTRRYISDDSNPHSLTAVRTHISRTASEVTDDSVRLKRHCSLKLIVNSVVQGFYYWLLSWSGKLRKAILASSCLSVRLSIHPSARNNSALIRRIFMKFQYVVNVPPSRRNCVTSAYASVEY